MIPVCQKRHLLKVENTFSTTPQTTLYQSLKTLPSFNWIVLKKYYEFSGALAHIDTLHVDWHIWANWQVINIYFLNCFNSNDIFWNSNFLKTIILTNSFLEDPEAQKTKDAIEFFTGLGNRYNISHVAQVSFLFTSDFKSICWMRYYFWDYLCLFICLYLL